MIPTIIIQLGPDHFNTCMVVEEGLPRRPLNINRLGDYVVQLMLKGYIVDYSDITRQITAMHKKTIEESVERMKARGIDAEAAMRAVGEDLAAR